MDTKSVSLVSASLCHFLGHYSYLQFQRFTSQSSMIQIVSFYCLKDHKFIYLCYIEMCIIEVLKSEKLYAKTLRAFSQDVINSGNFQFILSL